ncbi:MAG: S-layer homology domain-containing protein [Acidobacteria bacterium]|nr:S-layer homology domain-containing protein [Acidobacteriota bacterium]
MKRHNFIVFVAALCAALGASIAVASRPPGTSPVRAGVPASARTEVSRVVAPRASGGPDQFGYTWDDSVPFSWIDATDGTQLSLTTCMDVYQASIPFPFRYYGVVPTGMVIHYNGVLSFDPEHDRDSCPAGSLGAARAAPDGDWYFDNTGTIYMKTGGTAPDRWLVVEWAGLESVSDPTSTFTFEAILHEGGDITFQYLSMGSVGWSPHTGIVDFTGYDDLRYMQGQQIPAGTAVRFTHPASGAHAFPYPRANGSFVSLGQAQQQATGDLVPTLLNYGELGDDTFEVTVDSSWSLDLEGLVDTDGDGIVDTGPLAQLESVPMSFKVDAPATVGASNTAVITATSSVDPTVSGQMLVQNAVPARFALADLKDGWTGQIMVAQPTGTSWTQVTTEGRYNGGSGPTILEEPNGNLLVASFSMWGNPSVFHVVYTIRGRSGAEVLPATTLDPHTGATSRIWAWDLSAAATPDRRTGVIWHDDTYDSDDNENDNVYFAVLDEDGNILFGPQNVTNNTAFGQPGDLDVPFITGTHIAATGDNRFVLSWVAETERAAGTECNVYLAIYDSSGAQVKEIRNLSGLPAGGGMARYVGMGDLSDNRVLVAYPTTSGGQIEAHILDSDGTQVAATPLGGDGDSIDAVELAGKKTLIAWAAGGDAEFAILDPSFNLAVPATPLPGPAQANLGWGLSVTRDARGNGIVVWEAWQPYASLNYAYIDPTGYVMTPPTVFRTSAAPFFSGRNSGITTYRPFADVPVRSFAAGFIERLFDDRITSGCGDDVFCPNDPVAREQMAVFLLKSEHGSDYQPPPCIGIFSDLVCPGGFAVNWIEELYNEGITAGCGGGNYCPGKPVKRDQMAVFLLKAEHGSDYQPPACSGIFDDVACPGGFAVDWVEQLYNEGITTGCSATSYCPTNPVLRSQMAVFLTRAFGLP